MKEWILYCLLLSLIYAMSAQARSLAEQEMTAEIVRWDGTKTLVLDCAVFIPDFENMLGQSASAEIQASLVKKGFYPVKMSALQMLKSTQADSNGHSVTDFETHRGQKLMSIGRNRLYLTLSGAISKTHRKHKFLFRLYTLDQQKEVGSSYASGTLGQPYFNTQELPNCKARDN